MAGTDWPLAAAHLAAAAGVAGDADALLVLNLEILRAVCALGEGRAGEAERLAARAVERTEGVDVADLRCEALLVLGRCIRRRDYDRATAVVLVGAGLAEQHDEWTEGRRYLGLDVLARARVTAVPDDTASTTEEVPTHDIPALSA